MNKQKRFIKRIFKQAHNDLGVVVANEVILKIPAGKKWTILGLYQKNYHVIGVYINGFPTWFPDNGSGAEAGASVWPALVNTSQIVSQWTATGAVYDQTAEAVVYGGIWLPIPFTVYGEEILKVHLVTGPDESDQLMIRYIEEDWIEA